MRMQYVRKDLGSFNLHMIQTDKFKTITTRVVFHSPIVKEEITIRNVLSNILLQSTEKYSTKRSMIIEAENLYAADLYNNIQRVGNYITTSFILQVLNDCYTEDGNLDKALEFLSEVIYHPDVEDGMFREEKLTFVKKNLEVDLASIKENPNDYSQIRLREVFDSESPVSYRTCGYLEDLEKIQPSSLYQYYLNMLDKDFVDIYVVGDFDFQEMLLLIKKYFKFRKIKKKELPYEVSSRKIRRKRLIAKEKSSITQSKLGIICPFDKLSEDDRNYSLILANIILGGESDSKLFQEVREKNSLCYTIYSSFHRLDNFISIHAGIDKKNFDKTLSLITRILDDMRHGNFSDRDLLVAKEIYNTSLASIEENPMNIIREYMNEEMLGFAFYKERELKMNSVSKKDIIRVMKRVKMDTVFLLEGEKE